MTPETAHFTIRQHYGFTERHNMRKRSLLWVVLIFASTAAFSQKLAGGHINSKETPPKVGNYAFTLDLKPFVPTYLRYVLIVGTKAASGNSIVLVQDSDGFDAFVPNTACKARLTSNDSQHRVDLSQGCDGFEYFDVY
jgi:hypothetical protein